MISRIFNTTDFFLASGARVAGMFTLIGFLVGAIPALGQQATQYSMYMLNPFAYNPAYAGLDYSLSAAGVYRKQWVGLAGSPEQQVLQAHLPLYLLGGGIGVQVENDRLGVEQHLRASLSYAWHRNIGRSGLLSLGVRAGLHQAVLDGTRMRTPEGNYEGTTIDHQDLLLPGSRMQAVSPNAMLGVFYQAEYLDIGIAVENPLAIDLQFDGFSYTPARSYNAMFRYRWDVNRSWSVQPSVMVKTILSQTQVDFSGLVQYNDNIMGGVSFRGYHGNSVDAAILLFGFRLSSQLWLNYAYDITLSRLRDASSGSHEIMVRYDFGKPIGRGKLPPIIYNPRVQ